MDFSCSFTIIVIFVGVLLHPQRHLSLLSHFLLEMHFQIVQSSYIEVGIGFFSIGFPDNYALDNHIYVYIYIL